MRKKAKQRKLDLNILVFRNVSRQAFFEDLRAFGNFLSGLKADGDLDILSYTLFQSLSSSGNLDNEVINLLTGGLGYEVENLYQNKYPLDSAIDAFSKNLNNTDVDFIALENFSLYRQQEQNMENFDTFVGNDRPSKEWETKIRDFNDSNCATLRDLQHHYLDYVIERSEMARNNRDNYVNLIDLRPWIDVDSPYKGWLRNA